MGLLVAVVPFQVSSVSLVILAATGTLTIFALGGQSILTRAVLVELALVFQLFTVGASLHFSLNSSPPAAVRYIPCTYGPCLPRGPTRESVLFRAFPCP